MKNWIPSVVVHPEPAQLTMTELEDSSELSKKLENCDDDNFMDMMMSYRRLC